MRVLLPIIYHDLTHCIERAFRDAGHETHVVNWRRHQKNPSKVEQFVIKEAAQFKPDLAWCQFQAPGLTIPCYTTTKARANVMAWSSLATITGDISSRKATVGGKWHRH